VLPSGHTGDRTAALGCVGAVGEVVDSGVVATEMVLAALLFGVVLVVDEQPIAQMMPSNSVHARRRDTDA